MSPWANTKTETDQIKEEPLGREIESRLFIWATTGAKHCCDRVYWNWSLQPGVWVARVKLCW